MVKFNFENLISSLFALGFEQVDSVLFTLTLGKFLSEQRENKQFEYISVPFTKRFKEYVYFDGISYKLKAGLTFESDTKLFNDKKYSLKQFFSSGIVNRKLIIYFQSFDFREIIIQKINLYNIKKINMLSVLLSSKEKEIINDILEIEASEKEINDHNKNSNDFNNNEKILSKIKHI